MSVWSELGIVVALTLLNGVFAGSEIAMLAVRKTRLKELAENGRQSAALALRLRQDTERLLATVQIGISVIGAATAVFGGARLSAPLTRALEALGLELVYAEKLAFASVVALVSYLSLVLGELVPKSLALQRSEAFALTVARGLFVLSKLAQPAVWLLTKSSNAVLFPLKDSTTFAESRLSPDELQQLIEEAAAGGALSTEVSEVVSRTIDFGQLSVHAVMTPRTRIVSLPRSIARDELVRVLTTRRFTRYPVTVESDDDVAGYVVARDLFERLVAYPDAREIDLLALARDAPVFGEQTSAAEVMRKLQRGRAPLGLVIDEHGSVSGLVTVEDLAEEVFGEILEEDEVVTRAIRREEGGAAVVRGDTPLQELSRELDVDVEPRPGATTIAGLVIHAAGRIPAVGERIVVAPDLEAEVLEATHRQVRAVRLRMATKPDAESDT